MKIDVNLETGKVKAEFTLAELHEIMDALKAVRDGKAEVISEPVVAPTVAMWRLAVGSFTDSRTTYQTLIWFGSDGRKHGTCQCKDSVYRKNWCKHLAYSDRVRLASTASLS